jgi:hypothetical protein
MPHVSNAIGWIIFLALLNYMAFSLTGLTPMWGLCCALGKQLGMYVQLVNLGLCVALIIGGTWYGIHAVIKVGVTMVGFNTIPHLLAALFAFGRNCS